MSKQETSQTQEVFQKESPWPTLTRFASKVFAKIKQICAGHCGHSGIQLYSELDD